jgi:hypothetical protein
MKIAVGFSRTNFFPSKAIRFFTNSPISHTYIRYYDKTLKTYKILHSDFGGVQFTLAERFDAENIATYEYIIDDPRLTSAICKNLWHLQKGYNYKRIWSWMWLIIFKRWFVRKIKDPKENPKSLICVDFLLYILRDAGITDLQIGHHTPADLLKWFEENYEQRGWKKVIHENPKTLIDHVKEFLGD